MANDKQTVYIAAESRGGGIAKEIYGNSNAYAMTDGLASYLNAIANDKHPYCWAYVLRFAFEETVKLKPENAACEVRDRLVVLYQTVRSNKDWTRDQKEEVLRIELDSILSIESVDPTIINILYRVRTQKEGLVLALLVTEDGTNNLADRELRNMSIKRTIPYGSDTHKGLENTTGACFAYRLERCLGACLNLENPLKYNMRFIKAFSANKILPWPFDGAITIEEQGLDGKREYFLVDNWCLLGKIKFDEFDESIDQKIKNTNFDLDTYKILKRFLKNLKNMKKIKIMNRRVASISE